MLPTPSGRRGAVLTAASAAVVCLGVLAASGHGGGTDPGYLAVGGAGPSGAATGNVPPDGGVDLVPLDGDPSGSVRPPADTPAGTPATRASASSSAVPAAAPSPSRSPNPSSSSRPGSATTAPAPGSPTASTAPARLMVSAPTRAASDARWCEYVTVTFTNTGAQAAMTGTVTFGTHIIGLLGVDWGTVETDEAVPVPVEGGEKKEKTWEICVDAWRVPLGMRIETQDVTLT